MTLERAIAKGDVHRVTQLLQAGANPNIRHGTGFSNTPLIFMAVYMGSVDIIKVFIEYGLDPEITMSYGETMLEIASRENKLEVMKLLLSLNININKQDLWKTTALHTASFYGRFEAVDLLLSSGADFNLGNNHGQTPLHLACERGHLAIVERLLSSGADPLLIDNKGQTAIMVAVSQEIKDLIDQYAFPDVKNAED